MWRIENFIVAKGRRQHECEEVYQVGRLDDKVLGGGASKSQCSVNAFWGFANLRPLAPPHVEPAADSRQVCGVGMQVCDLDR